MKKCIFKIFFLTLQNILKALTLNINIMKDLIGRWKISELKTFDAKTDKMIWINVAEAMKNPDVDEDIKQSASAIFEFGKDGKMDIMFEIPEDAKEEVDAAVAAGECSLRDGLLVAESFDWKIENGKPMYDSKTEGEILGEKVNPWVELEETPDGYEIMTFRIVKM